MASDEPARAPGFVRSAAAVMRHEVRLAFHSPMSYVLALGFALSISVAIFAVGEFLSTNEASVRLFALFLPWVAIVFVPALAMRAWSAGYDDRSLEFAMSLPIGDGALVTGKFLAGLVVLAFVLVLAAVFPVTVHYLGEPDLGATAGAWIAAFALLAAFHAVALAGRRDDRGWPHSWRERARCSGWSWPAPTALRAASTIGCRPGARTR